MISAYATLLVHRLAYLDDVAAGQLAVSRRVRAGLAGPGRTGGKGRRISGLILVERATRKNSQPAAAQSLALKMGRRLRCLSVTYQLRYAPSNASPARTALPAAHFEGNDITTGTDASRSGPLYPAVPAPSELYQHQPQCSFVVSSQWV
jgi:hypothetical protein